MTIPIAPLAGLAVGVLPIFAKVQQSGWKEGVNDVMWKYMAYNPWTKKLDITGLWQGLFPLTVGVLIHKFVGGKLGVNRALSQAKVPFIRI
jgi:hypothetical protein